MKKIDRTEPQTMTQTYKYCNGYDHCSMETTTDVMITEVVLTAKGDLWTTQNRIETIVGSAFGPLALAFDAIDNTIPSAAAPARW